MQDERPGDDAEAGGRMRRARRWAADRPSACAVVASLLLTAVVLAVLPWLRSQGQPAWNASTALLVVTFFLAQSCVIDIEFRRQSRSVSLSEIPFVLGLLFLAPLPFLVARLTGGLLSQVVV